MGRASSQGLVEFNLVQIRDFAENKYRTVDEPPYGGGEGMVMKADVCAAALKSVQKKKGSHSKVIFVSPQGRLFDQSLAKELSQNAKEITLVCGHYEGIDERFIEKYVDLEVSIGDYVLTGGELPAMVILDAVTRILPGAVGNERSISQETFENGLLKYPQYTRPREFEASEVPEVLLSGNHKLIERWRFEKMCERTKARRLDLWQKFESRNLSNAKVSKTKKGAG